jgi:hypothetical protein
MPQDQSQLDRGLLYTSGRECLPLPICIGELLRIHENRGPGEIAGLFVPQGAHPASSMRIKATCETERDFRASFEQEHGAT